MARVFAGLVWGCGVLLLCGVWPQVHAAERFTSLTFSISSASQSRVGEPVVLEFEITNETAELIIAHRYINVVDGFIRIFISFEGGPLKKLTDPGWGLKDIRGLQHAVILPGERLVSTGTVLKNHYVFGEQGSLESELAFQYPGTYFVKAKFFHLAFNESVESDPIRIDILPSLR